MSEWMPIETAPYGVNFIATNGRDVCAPCFMERPGVISVGRFFGWWQSSENGFFVEIEPTHWMPLPQNPETNQ